MERSDLAIIIPALNEATTIEKVIKKIRFIGTIIVVDDGSSDRTYEVAKKQKVIVLQNQKNLGYDYSLNMGIKYAMKKFKYLVTFDADNQHNANDLKRVVYKLKNGYDIVYGVRNKVIRISEKIFINLSKLFFGIQDPLSGLKGYNLNLFKKLKYNSNLITLGSEILFLAQKKKMKICSIKISIKKRKDNSRIGGILKSNFLIIKAMVTVFFIYLNKND